MAAELAEGEGRTRAQIGRAGDTASNKQIAARAAIDLAELEFGASGHVQHLPVVDGFAGKRGRDRRRMMSEIVKDRDTARCPSKLQASLDAVKDR